MRQQTTVSDVSTWLAAKLKASPGDINRLYEERSASQFLFLWGLFEKICFGNFMKVCNIEPYARQHTTDTLIELLEEECHYFHTRYQDRRRWANLHYGFTVPPTVNTARCEDYTRLHREQKLAFMLFVVYRYRNNMFHGVKGLASWLEYTEQINKCNCIMMEIVDAYIRQCGAQSLTTTL